MSPRRRNRRRKIVKMARRPTIPPIPIPTPVPTLILWPGIGHAVLDKSWLPTTEVAVTHCEFQNWVIPDAGLAFGNVLDQFTGFDFPL